MRPSFLLPLSLVLFGCQGPASPSQELPDTPAPAPEVEAADVDDDGMVMRTYSVEPDRVREVRSVLGRLLQGANEQPDRGRVEELGGGRIVIFLDARGVSEAASSTSQFQFRRVPTASNAVVFYMADPRPR
jgi:hypothetical protein